MNLARFLVAFFGLITILISGIMIAKPAWWRERTVRFCQLRFMHPLEIHLRIGFGVPFIYYAERSPFPVTLKIIGYLLVAVGVGLLLIGPANHRRFGLWSIERAAKYFRPAGFVSLPFGVFLVHAAW